MWTQRILPALVGLFVLLALLGLRAADPAPIAAMREAGFALLERLAPRDTPAKTPVLRVEIDPDAGAGALAWPWPRDRLAQLVQRLDELGAAAIALDLDLSTPDPLSPSRLAGLLPELDPGLLPDTDSVLAEAFGSAPVILVVRPTASGPPLHLPAGTGLPLGSDMALIDLPVLDAARLPLPRLLQAARGLAVMAPGLGVTRELPMLWRNERIGLPALALEALRLAEGSGTIALPQIGDAAPGTPLITLGRYSLPVSDAGRLRLYRSGSESAAPLPASDLLGVGYRRLGEQVANRIVLVGLADQGGALATEAQAIEQITAGQFLARPDWARPLESFGFALLGLLTLAVTLALGPLAGTGVVLAGGAAMVVTSWLGFVTQGLLLDVSFPLAGLLLVLLTGTALYAFAIGRRREALRAQFAGRLAPALIERLIDRTARQPLDAERRPIVVLEARLLAPESPDGTPQQQVRQRNSRLQALAEAVLKSEGMVERASGDGLLAIWNAPLERAEPEHNAARCALAMRPSGGVRLGLVRGEALLGHFGVAGGERFGALGEVLEAANRLQQGAGAVGYDLVISEEMRAALADFALLEAGLPPIGPQARREALHLLVGDATMAQSGAFRLLSLAHGETIRLLRDGGDPRGGIFECRSLAEKLEPSLVGFYDRLASRRADFL